MKDDVRVLPTLHRDSSLKISTTALFDHFGVADAIPDPGATDPHDAAPHWPSPELTLSLSEARGALRSAAYSLNFI